MSNFPKGWCAATVGDTARYINGLAFKPEDWGREGRPIIRIQNLTDPQKEFNRTKTSFDDDYIVRSGEILVSWSATLDAFLWEREDGVLNQHIFRVVPYNEIDKKFLFHLLRAAIAEMRASEHLHGSTMKHINRGPFLAHGIGLPPGNEQRRIANKLDAIFERTRAARARLESLPAMLDQLRQSILAAAFRGDLTKDWREAHPDVEPASVLLERIRAERRRRWEEGLRAKGKDPKRATYEEPAPVDASELPELPEGWAWARVDEAGEVQLGRQRAPQYLTGRWPRPYLRVANVKEDRISFDDVETMDFDPDDFAKYRLAVGDILLSEGQSPELVGESAIYQGGVEGLCYQKTLHRFRAAGSLTTSTYMQLVFRHFLRAGVFRDNASLTTNIAHLTLVRLKPIPVPIAPLAEQAEAVRRANAALARVEAAARAVAVQMKGLAALEQSALAKAFRGELVAQDSTDEPASALLERMRAARSDEPVRSRGRTRSSPPGPLSLKGEGEFAVKGDSKRARSARTAPLSLQGEGSARSAGGEVSGSARSAGGEASGALEPLDAVLTALRERGQASSAELQRATGLDAADLRPLLKSLERLGKVAVEGKARGTAYVWRG